MMNSLVNMSADRAVEFVPNAKIRAMIGENRCFMPTQLAIETVRACNAKCIMCPSTTMQRPKGFMPKEVHETILSKIKQWGAPISLITHAGIGEPLLDKMLEERIKREKEVFPNAKIIVYTNGGLLDEERALKLIASGVDVVSFSVNGFRKETYEAVMKIPRDITYENVERFCRLKEQTGSKVSVCVSLVKTDICSQQEVEEYKQYWDTKNVTIVTPPWISWGNLFEHSIRKPKLPCFYIWKTMMFDNDGTVKMCCEDYDSRYPMGNIMTQEPSEIFNSLRMQEQRNNQLNGNFTCPDICKNCIETLKLAEDFWDSSPLLCSEQKHEQAGLDSKMISVFDTSVCDNNLGNQIIMDSVDKYLRQIFPSDFFIRLPYLDNIDTEAVKYIKASEFVFLGGTNALSSEMEKYKQIGIDHTNYEQIKKIVLLGVGWWQYQGAISNYTQQILKHCLHPSVYHSVRDSYTKNKLSDIGIKNVLVTGCPTLWRLTEEHCRQIPRNKSENVLLTFTNYSQDKSDSELFNIVQNSYKNIFVWVQGPEDLEYAKSFGGKINILSPRLEALDELLLSDIELDYVGTRCHAGIRAMQFKRRTIIIGVDNRAIEMQKDFNLPVVPRENLYSLQKIISSEFETKLNIPFDIIRQWGRQFSVNFYLEVDTPDKQTRQCATVKQASHLLSNTAAVKECGSEYMYNCLPKEYKREKETNNNIVWLRPRVDPNGKVFEKGGKIFRAMKNSPDYYERLLAIIHSNKVLRETVIETRLCDETLPKYNSILEHKKIKLFTSPGDWSYSMFKDALIAHLKVHIELLSNGYTLQDGHLWNVTFDGSSPKFIDFGSIIEYRDNILGSKKEYLHFCITPLLMMALGYFDKARVYLRVSTNLYLAGEDVYGYINKHKESLAVKQYHEILNILSQTAVSIDEYKAQLFRIYEIVKAFNYESKSIWSVYHKAEEEGQIHNKITELENFLKSKKNLNVLDIGCASGFYSMLAAKYGHNVVATEIDMAALDYTYNKAKAKNYNITSILRNLMEAKADLSGNKYDVVIANAIIHHLAFTQKMSLEEIVEKISEYCKQYLFIEYINENDDFVKKHINDYQFEYSYDKLKGNLETKFDIVNVFPSSSDKRRLVLCKIKDKVLLSNQSFNCSLNPISRKFGFDRGIPIDRYYIEKFITANASAIHGKVLEIGDNSYTKKFGVNVVKSDVLNAVQGEGVTIVGDLTNSDCLPENYFDCMILTQTLHVIYDVKDTIKNAIRALKPGGTLLITTAGISQISRYDMDRWGDYWRFTDRALQKMFSEFMPPEAFEIKAHGNVAIAKAFLDGLAVEDIDKELFEYDDNDYQVILTVRATKPVSTVNKINFSGKQNKPVILLYHRVADEPVDYQLLCTSPRNFENHLQTLSQNYRVIRLAELLNEIRNNRFVPNTVALTFDDGYVDNLNNALPLLEKHKIPATIFVTSGMVGLSGLTWWDAMSEIFLRNQNLPCVLQLSDSRGPIEWDLSTPQKRVEVHDEICRIFRDKSAQEIYPVIDQLLQWSGLKGKPAGNARIVDEQELLRLSQSEFIDVGSHTVWHSKLTALTCEQQEFEFGQSAKHLQAIIHKPVEIVSYPFGGGGDFDATTKQIAQKYYSAGIANVQSELSGNIDMFAVPRRLVRNWTGEQFEGWLKSDDRRILESQAIAARKDNAIRYISKLSVNSMAMR